MSYGLHIIPFPAKNVYVHVHVYNIHVHMPIMSVEQLPGDCSCSLWWIAWCAAVFPCCGGQFNAYDVTVYAFLVVGWSGWITVWYTSYISRGGHTVLGAQCQTLEGLVQSGSIHIDSIPIR